MLVWTFGIMVWMNWPLALASLAVLPFVTWAIGYFADRVRRQSTTIQERESDLLALTQEGISQIRMVHAFGRESFEIRQFRKRAARSLEAGLRFNITSIVSSLVVGTLMAAGTALMYYVGARQVLEGALTLGDLTVFATYLLMLYQPLEQLSYTAWAMEGAAAGAARCFEVLDREDDVPDAPNAKPIENARGDIEFREVSFGYSHDRPILTGINLSIVAGKCGLWRTGGKFSLALPRRRSTSGGVFLDGRNLRELTKKSVRLQIGMVLQDTILFSTTIKENIAYGRPGATDEQIIEAAKRAQAYDFIMKMPHGFSSAVGERGSHLSVGQRQRIGIARAFLKDAPILLLDEPTSALDPSTEHAIAGTIGELARASTLCILTHRLATIHSLGRIVVLEKHGTIAEQGTVPSLTSGPVCQTLPGRSNIRNDADPSLLPDERPSAQTRSSRSSSSQPRTCQFREGAWFGLPHEMRPCRPRRRPTGFPTRSVCGELEMPERPRQRCPMCPARPRPRCPPHPVDVQEKRELFSQGLGPRLEVAESSRQPQREQFSRATSDSFRLLRWHKSCLRLWITNA
jgi:ATP-binding cassette subfamily B protein/subfamily B ATP-binding cassette protein MsbA